MKYYNQNDYPHTPYPSKAHPKATIKTGGCGVCCASHIVEGLTGQKFPPPEAAKFAIACGARGDGGTIMSVLAKALAAKYGLTYSTTDSRAALLAHLATGGMAVANVGGDRPGYTGVFSDGGHYVTVIGRLGGTLRIYDSGYYSGKFNRSGRVGKVNMVGNEARCASAMLDADCANRSPRYYLFKEAKPMNTQTVSPWAKEAWEWAKKAGLLDGTNPKDPVTREQLAAILQKFAAKYIEK